MRLGELPCVLTNPKFAMSLRFVFGVLNIVRFKTLNRFKTKIYGCSLGFREGERLGERNIFIEQREIAHLWIVLGHVADPVAQLQRKPTLIGDCRNIAIPSRRCCRPRVTIHVGIEFSPETGARQSS